MNDTTGMGTLRASYAQVVNALRARKFSEVELHCREALAGEPGNAAWHDLLGTVLRQRGDVRCVESALAAVAADPSSALFLFNLGDCYRRANQPEQAVAAYRKSLALREMPQAYRALAAALESLEKVDEAIAALARSAELEPGSQLAHGRLLGGLYRAGRFAACVTAGPAALHAAGNDPEIHLLIGLSQLRLEQFTEAVEALRASARVKPTAACFAALAAAANGAGEHARAASAAREALRLSPDDIEGHKQLGIALHRLGEMTAAGEHLRTVLRSNPRDGHCLVTLATIELARLQPDESMRLLDEASKLCDDAPVIASKRLMVMNYAPVEQEREIFGEHVRFGERLAQRIAASKGTGYTGKNRSGRLRVGYVSPDFCEHAVANFAEALLRPVAGIDEEIVIFSDCARPDAVTRRLQSYGNTWHDTRQLNHAQLAALVERERIDILVDLAGHTSDNRLEMFALRPAPAQMTYLGYPNTTGLPREVMQYRLTDAICDPPGAADELHSETLLRLPEIFLCYRSRGDAPAVAEPPCLRNGYVTFGCFSNIAKLSWQTLEQWAGLLRETPGSHLMMKNHSLMDERLCESIRRFFAEQGVAQSRITLSRGEPAYIDHLARYGDIDIALDTFPYNGTTTICEALWMGVPVVSLSGNSHRSRVGRSILQAVGLDAFTCDSTDAFRTIAADAAQNFGKLATLRSELRTRMASSGVMNGLRFRSDLHAAFAGAAGR